MQLNYTIRYIIIINKIEKIHIKKKMKSQIKKSKKNMKNQKKDMDLQKLQRF